MLRLSLALSAVAAVEAEFSFAVIGDWGAAGQTESIPPAEDDHAYQIYYNQVAVAGRLKVLAEERDLQFMFNVGDNFYPSKSAGCYIPTTGSPDVPRSWVCSWHRIGRRRPMGLQLEKHVRQRRGDSLVFCPRQPRLWRQS